MRRILPAFLLIACHLLLFWRVWIGTAVVLDRDLAYLHYPMKAAAARLWLEGRLPQWDPGTLNGQPLAANPNYASFYPATPALGGDDPVRAGSLILAAHHLWLVAGFLALARRTRASALATVLGGLVVSLSGPMLSTLPYYNLLVGVSWAPWLAWATTLSRPPARIATGAAAFALSVLAGSPFAAFACLCTAAAWIALDPARARLRALTELAAAAAAGTVAAAVQLIPAGRLFGATLRSVPKPYAESLGYYSFHPLRTLELVVPGIFGNPAGTLHDDYWGRALSDSGGPLLDSAYLGLTVLVLCVLAVGRRQLPVVAAAVLCLAVAWGHHLGLHQLLVTALPPLSQLRFPEKYLLLIPLLAALALLRLELPSGRPSRIRLAAAAAAAAVLALAGLAGSDAIAAALPAVAGSELAAAAADQAVRQVRAGCLLAAFWIVATSVVVTVPMRDSLRRLAVAALVAADLLAAQVAASYQLPSQRVAAAPAFAETLRAERCRRLYHQALDDVALRPPPTITGYTELVRESLYPRVGTMYGVAYALDPPVDLMETAAMGRNAIAAQGAGGADRAMLEQLGVSHILHSSPRLPFAVASTTATPVGFLSRLETAAPLWFRAASRAAPEPADVTGLTGPLGWRLQVPAPGVLATDISFAPGWRATVNGRPADCEPTELGTIAVPVPPGSVDVLLEYRAPGLRLGLAISIAAWLALGGTLAAGLRTARPDRAAAAR